MSRFNISFIGAGRVAGALCRELFVSGHKIGLIVSSTEKNGKILAASCKSSWSPDPVFPEATDIILVAVPDHNLENVLFKINCGRKTLVAHTAGSIGLDVFPEQKFQKGVLYPLQTFTRERRVIFKDLPFFIEASDSGASTLLEQLTLSLGGKVYFADSEHRRMVHLSAVFVSNFLNHILTAGKELTLKSGYPFELMKPLILETVLKAIELGPENSQTGPAVRNDKNTIEKHLELLSFSPDLKRIYQEMTRSITEYYKNR
jgi:predicted short-subunit dehydrogenase-like oxidoreductase (DUF2520 family)